MIPRRALTLAIHALESERQHIAVEANLCDMYGARHPSAVNASARRKEINQAIETLKIMMQPMRGLPLLEK
jgi:hypothetical protein